MNEVRDVPKGFADWVEKNKERIKKAEAKGTVLYFIADNREVVKDILEGNKDKEDADNKAFLAKKRQEYKDYIEKGWLDLYFDDISGAYNVAHPLHQFSKSMPKGAPKTGGEAEKFLGEQLARQGKAIAFLPESGING